MREDIAVFLVDDHPVVRHGIRSMLSGAEGIAVVGEGDSGVTALRGISQVRPAVVLLDVRLSTQDGIHLVPQIKLVSPRTRVIMLTVHDDPTHIRRSFEADADGYLLKKIGPNELAEAIRLVSRGERVIAPELTTALVGEFAALAREQTRNAVGLTESEVQLLSEIARGATNRDLADQLFWSEITVRRKVQEVFRKLEVTNRAEAVAKAIRGGLI